MKLLDSKTLGDLIRLTVFIVVTTLATGLLVVLIGNLDFASSSTYKAVFSDVAGLNKGDDVRIAGVKVGTVKSISIHDRDEAEITFSVQKTTSLGADAQAQIHYRNLVGQRYVDLQPDTGEGGTLPPGGTIPESRTQPALDLTLLFNGFKPLFQALSPDDLNKLSYEIIQVFQGEGGTLEDLLRSTASVTNTLADRDQVIGALIDNLNDVLAHIGARDAQLSSLIKTFRSLLDGLKTDRKAILGSLGGISQLAQQTASLVKGIRPPFINDIHQLRRVATSADNNKAELSRSLQVLPIKLSKIGRTAIYGSWFNFYLCDVKGNVELPGNITIPIQAHVGASRCHLG